MRPNTVARQADAFVHWIRLDRVILLGRLERRSLRWWPALALLAMPIGYALIVAAIDDPAHSVVRLAVGGILLFGTMIAVCYMRVLGPRLAGDIEHRLDERETMLRARAGHVSGRIIVLLAIAGCFYCGAAHPLELWMPRRPIDWIYLGLMIEGWAITLPVLVASWLQPRERD